MEQRVRRKLAQTGQWVLGTACMTMNPREKARPHFVQRLQSFRSIQTMCEKKSWPNTDINQQQHGGTTAQHTKHHNNNAKDIARVT